MRFTIVLPNRLLAFAAVGATCFTVGLVAAAELPSADGSLTYSGRLTDSVGTPRSTTESITVTLFDAASSGASLCAASQPAVDLGASQGRFSVSLPELCNDAIAEAGDAWAEVKVGSSTLPRQKLGAVPFALVAGEALSADFAVDAASAAMALGVAANGVSKEALQGDSVDASKISPAAVGASELAGGSVEADKLAAGSVTTTKLGASAVTSDKIAPNAVGADKLAVAFVASVTANAEDIELLVTQAGELATADAVLGSRLDTVSGAFAITDGFAARNGQSAASWTSTLTTSSTAATDFPIALTRYDEQTELSAASKGFVAKHPGLYLISGSWDSEGIADQCPVLVYATKNDSRVSGLIQVRQSSPGTDVIGSSLAHVERLAPGDIVRFRAGITSCGSTPKLYGIFQVTRLN